jgi:HAD superfamily phosphoserine phosphatase-like hydrolase
MQMIKFLFDLDGTITLHETLPIIARHFGISAEIDILTRETVAGNVPFVESFIKRINILGKLPVDEVSKLLSVVPLCAKIVDFIHAHKENCVIITGNLGCWVDRLVERIGCTCHNSEGIVENNAVVKLTHILKKESVVDLYHAQGYKVVVIGDGNNDMEAMRRADISIAAGIIHCPAHSVLATANYAVFSEYALCRQLEQITLEMVI